MTLPTKAHIRNHYIRTKRDDELSAHLDWMVQNAKECLEGGGGKQRCLFILGQSGTGKTRTLLEHFKNRPEFQPYEGEGGEVVSPLLSLEAPSPCNTKTLASALLTAMHIPHHGRLSEYQLSAMLKRQLRERGVLFVHIDEMQHVLSSGTRKNIQSVQDVLKSLVQVEGWPLHTIYSGMPELAVFLEGDRQLANRSRVMRFQLLSEKHVPFVEQTVTEIVTAHFQITPGWKDNDELYAKLIVAASGSLGTLIEMVQEACFHALSENTCLNLKSFQAVYFSKTGCIPQDNVFTARNWREIIPSNSLADLHRGNIKG
ncbi:TniB family NTP-binding protein [Rhizobium sp.]|jgi:hypothetical protein|uniref:TniB family NTP-binding protein n=1 Tax=Rhizobium sp. TaxID=391 RepID=UPI000E8D00F8|nr:transposase [Rhizobium sp.]